MQDNSIIVAMTGASGAIYGIKLLEYLSECGVITHLIVSKAALLTISQELELSIRELKTKCSYFYNINDIGAKIASGSFKTLGMIVAPCSSNSLAAIAHGYENNLITRAASVTLKERRTLVLMLRESPLHIGHIKNMLAVSEYGAIIAPPVPAFYNKPKNLDDLVTYSVGRVLDLFNISIDIHRWNGISNQLVI